MLFRSAAALLEELHRQTPEGRRRKLRSYANVGLLCIDEVGYLSFDDKAADLLYEVVNRRYERKPVILTTNRPFKEWNEVFPNATCIVDAARSTAASCRCHGHRRRQLSGSRKRAGNRRPAEEEMNPPAATDSDPANYVAAVLILYVELPETPMRANVQDQWQARRLHDRGVPLRVVESAFLLASLRRLARPVGWSTIVTDSIAGLLPAGHRRTPGASRARQLSGLPAP